jgi:hypothetical protein
MRATLVLLLPYRSPRHGVKRGPVADFGLASGKEFLAGLLDKIKVPNHVVRGMIARAHVLLIL